MTWLRLMGWAWLTLAASTLHASAAAATASDPQPATPSCPRPARPTPAPQSPGSHTDAPSPDSKSNSNTADPVFVAARTCDVWDAHATRSATAQLPDLRPAPVAHVPCGAALQPAPAARGEPPVTTLERSRMLRHPSRRCCRDAIYPHAPPRDAPAVSNR